MKEMKKTRDMVQDNGKEEEMMVYVGGRNCILPLEGLYGDNKPSKNTIIVVVTVDCGE